MVNVAVINLRNLVKPAIKALIVVSLLIIISIYLASASSLKKEIENEEVILPFTGEYILSSTLPEVSRNINEGDKKESTFNLSKILLGTEMKVLNNIKEHTKIEDGDHVLEEAIENTNIESVPNNVFGEVVLTNNIESKYNVEYGSVKIKNETEYNLTEEMMTPNIEINMENVLIFNTHTCESYTSSQEYPYEPTGNYRTTNLDYTVTRVAKELADNLKASGFTVIQDTTYHDYPAYSGSYGRSLTTVQNILSNNNIDMVFDLHRDALGSNSDYAPKVKLGDEYAAQLMFVIGTNAGGLEHSSWVQNLKFAIKVQQKANELYPGLFRSINLTNSRYNQHAAKAANIVEVGATGNTLEEAILSMRYLAKVLSEI